MTQTDPRWPGQTRYPDPAFEILDQSFARYRLDEHTTLTGRVRNLTDEVYAKQAYNSQYYMGPPRTFELALDMRF